MNQPNLFPFVLETKFSYGNRVTTSSGEDVASFLRASFPGIDREVVTLLCLNAKNEVMSAHIVHIGALSQSLFDVRTILRTALMANASAIIISHNHPSGDLTPSPEDIACTRRLLTGADAVGILVLDHIIWTSEHDGHLSFRSKNLVNF